MPPAKIDGQSLSPLAPDFEQSVELGDAPDQRLLGRYRR